MSEIVRTTVEENDANIIKSQVMNVLDDNLIRHQVRGLEQPAPEPPVLETLNVTENGTYTPEEGVDGFDEVNVNVPAPVVNDLISQIKVVDVEGTPTIKDVKRDFVLTSNNAITITDGNIDFGSDANCYLNCQVSQQNLVPYVIEADIVSCNFPTDVEGSSYKGIFTFGRNKSTLWGLYFNGEATEETGKGIINFRPQSGESFASRLIAPSELVNKTLKLYCNCGLDNNNNIVFKKNNALIYLGDELLINNTLTNYAGQGWDQMCSMGWSSYSWGCPGLVISEYRVRQLSKLM